ncbi:MAG TPA: glycosyltransferase family 2 protein [Edaphocola sp.]|nr:glycosyltransferase family 2 protein [Edaphocola sp.]
MNSNELISVVIPIYNVNTYLEKCVSSVISQSYKNLEIILVNDGSTDNSGEIAEDFAKNDKRIKVVHQENGGLSAARNTGLKHTSGDYVFYLDSDDYLASNALELLIGAAIKYNAEIVQANFYYDYPDYLLLNIQQKEEEIVYQMDKAIWALLEHKTVFNFAWGKLIKSELAKKYLFPMGKFYEDGFWKYKIIFDSKVYVSLKIPILYYLQRGNAISGNFSMRNLDQLEGEIQRIEFIKENFSEKYYDLALAQLNKKIILHKSLLNKLDKDEAEIYSKKIQQIQNQFHLTEKFPSSNSSFFKKAKRIQSAIKSRLNKDKNWKRIKK